MAQAGAAAELVATTIRNYEKSGEDGISEQLVELQMLKKKGRVTPNQGGAGFSSSGADNTYTWQIATTELTPTPWDGNAVANPSQTNIWVQPAVGIAGSRVLESISRFDEQRNSGPERLIDIVAAKQKAMFYALGKLICQSFNDDGSATAGKWSTNNVVIGLPGAVKTSGSYAGISYSSDPVFFGSGNNVLSGAPYNSFTSDPFPALAQAVGAVIRGNDWGETAAMPDVITLDFNNYQLLQAQVFQQARVDMSVDKADMGFETLKWQGVHIIPSRFQTTNRMFVLNSKSLEFRHMTNKVIQYVMGVSPLTQDVTPFQCMVGGNFLVREPRYNAIVTLA